MNFISPLARKWAGQTFISIFDQVVYSGTNFILSVLLARIMTPDDYGVYAIVTSFFLFLSGFNNALILEPVSVIGPIKKDEEIPSYFSSVNILNNKLSLLLGLCLLITGYIYITFNTLTGGGNISFEVFIAAAIYLPFTFGLWYVRRLCYIFQKPIRALVGNFLYALSIFLLLGLFWKLKIINSASAFIILGLSGFFVYCGYAMLFPALFTKRITFDDAKSTRHIILEHWNYGKWVVGSAFVYWISTGFYMPLMGLTTSLNDVGAFRALQILIMPFQQILTGFTLLVLPWLARFINSQGEKKIPKIILIISLVSFLVSVLYTILLLFVGPMLVSLFYGQTTIFQNYLWLIPYYGGMIIFTAIGQGPMLALKAIKKSSFVFWAQLGGAVFTLTIGLFLVYRLRVSGVAIAMLITHVIINILPIIFLVKGDRKLSLS